MIYLVWELGASPLPNGIGHNFPTGDISTP